MAQKPRRPPQPVHHGDTSTLKAAPAHWLALGEPVHALNLVPAYTGITATARSLLEICTQEPAQLVR